MLLSPPPSPSPLTPSRPLPPLTPRSPLRLEQAMNAEQHAAVAGKVHELKRKDEEILLARQDAAKQAKLKDLQVVIPLSPQPLPWSL